jgi:hypothetical protein
MKTLIITASLMVILSLTACGGTDTVTTTPPVTTPVTTSPIAPPTATADHLSVTTDAASRIGVSGATLSGSTADSGKDTIDQRGFDWGTVSGKYEYSWAESGSFQPGLFTGAVTGLTEGTTYYFRGKAHNSGGWKYGGEKIFKTLLRPSIIALDIVAGKQGEALTVSIKGNGFTGAGAIDFGDGITVDSYTVDNDTTITARITIADLAAGGVRIVSVTTAAGTCILDEAFTVERILRTVIWTDADFDWLSHFLTGEGQYTYHIHLKTDSKMHVTSVMNFDFGIEVRDGKLCYTNVPQSAWDNVYYTSYPHLRYDTLNHVMITDSLPLEVLHKLFVPPEETMPMIETIVTGDGTITITYYSP